MVCFGHSWIFENHNMHLFLHAEFFSVNISFHSLLFLRIATKLIIILINRILGDEQASGIKRKSGDAAFS